ncbi:LysR substrate-binding domain-containing protein [Sneathiella marina]|uniref:LysR substrate-binding domain-containing protein n=1 Tax=Sneathiella marina TaxID=2950108 RepID=A0ABY4W089_9PROT|nr:LysR substrate-binding domain-containing protein [Sneathiella marina]USG60568.1 LysR substrate-binding domain-containing protein [Sneathiella marina]
MDLAELRIFCAVVREGSVTRAAERLHRVQSNVTTRLRQLEDKLGVELFSREGKRLKLTAAGRTLLTYADQLLSLADEAEIALKDRQPRGLFRLGSMESTAAVRLPGPLADYSARYPEVKLELRTGNPTEMAALLSAGDIDAALVAEPVALEKFDRLLAFEEETVIVTAINQPDISAPGAAPKCMLVFEQGCPHRRLLEGWYAARGELPERVIEMGSYHAMLGCALAGMGAALMPKSILSTFPEAARLISHPLPKGKNVLRTYYIWRKESPAPNVTALGEILQEN